MFDTPHWIANYLQIPDDFGPAVGLRWSDNLDLIETNEGTLFVFRQQLSLFVEGYASQAELPHLGFLLDMLHLLGYGEQIYEGIPIRQVQRVREAFQRTAKDLRNAGVFFATLWKEELPAYGSCLSGKSNIIINYLTNPSAFSFFSISDLQILKLEPAWSVSDFRSRLADRLFAYTDADLRSWFRHGKSFTTEEQAEPFVEEILRKPPSLSHVLSTVVQDRPRLSRSLPLIDHLVGALTLPPRKQHNPQLPLGGYVDVTNRGAPERLLPSQFALDPDEFVRRFAEQELLYFRKEEPHERTKDELLVILDQGVRTWGSVRLMLTAAVLALGKLAVQKKFPFRIVFTVDPVQPHDPVETDLSRLGDLLEASDLSLNPIEALTRTFSGLEKGNRDLVLLTHPRTLMDAKVQQTMTDLPEDCRLFALTATEEGQIAFQEIRSGVTLPIRSFHVTLPEPVSERIPKLVEQTDWKGDCEPLPFPFRFGLPHGPNHYCLDNQTEHLFTVSDYNLLHCWTIADGSMEILPRAYWDGKLLNRVQSLHGVDNGVVVCGNIDNHCGVVHYDLPSRTVKCYLFEGARGWNWYVYSHLNCVILRRGTECQGIDLRKKAWIQPQSSIPDDPIVIDPMQMALNFTSALPVVPPELTVITPGLNRPVPKSALFTLIFWQDIGQIELDDNPLFRHLFGTDASFGSFQMVPLSDGKPVLKHKQIRHAYLHGSVLVIHYGYGHQLDQGFWIWIDVLNKSVLREWKLAKKAGPIVFSQDGSRMVVPISHQQLSVQDSSGNNDILFQTILGRVHNNLWVELGSTSMNLSIGKMRHHLRWKEGPLQIQYSETGNTDTLDGAVVISKQKSHPRTAYDSDRFNRHASKNLDVFVDVYGQVFVWDNYRDSLVCAFFVRRKQFAAWMPGGVWYGPQELTGHRETPNALLQIGEALRQAGQTSLLTKISTIR